MVKSALINTMKVQFYFIDILRDLYFKTKLYFAFDVSERDEFFS